MGAAVFALLLLPWALGFVLAGAQFVGDHAWEMLAVTRWAATNTQVRPARGGANATLRAGRD